MHKKRISVYEAYQLIEPGPVVMVSTAHGDEKNIMTMAWHMVIEFKPPMMAFMLSNQNHSFELLKKSGECVLNIPDVELAHTVVRVGNCTGAKIDKFKKFGLTATLAAKVKAPLIAECYANIECKVIDTQLVNTYNIFIVKVVAAWKAKAKKQFRMMHHRGRGVFVIDGKIIRIPSKKTGS